MDSKEKEDTKIDCFVKLDFTSLYVMLLTNVSYAGVRPISGFNMNLLNLKCLHGICET